MARQPLNEAAKDFLKGTESVEPKAKKTQKTTKRQPQTDIMNELALTPKEKPTPMTITILPTRRKKLETLSQETGRGMSDLIGIALDRIFEEAKMD